MDITTVPFNHLVGIRRDEPPFVLRLDESSDYTNHIGTVHASAQFALAEATSGETLLNHLGPRARELLFVVRRVDVKFRNPMRGCIRSRAGVEPDVLVNFSDQLAARRRALVVIPVEIVNESGDVGLKANFEWFVRDERGATAG